MCIPTVLLVLCQYWIASIEPTHIKLKTIGTKYIISFKWLACRWSLFADPEQHQKLAEQPIDFQKKLKLPTIIDLFLLIPSFYQSAPLGAKTQGQTKKNCFERSEMKIYRSRWDFLTKESSMFGFCRKQIVFFDPGKSGKANIFPPLKSLSWSNCIALRHFQCSSLQCFFSFYSTSKF